MELRGYNSNAVPQRFLLHNHDDMYLLSRKRRLNLTLIIVVSIMAATGAVTAVSGQLTSASSPSWVNLLVQLRSNDSEVRSGAFDQLRLDPTALRDPEVKAALVNLLDRENEETVTGDEEDYSMYVDTLSDTVTKLVDWSDPRQVCILANSVYPPAELADHARIAVPCLLRRLKKNVPHTFQGQVVAMMVQALAKGKRELDPAAMQAARQATLSGLHDPDEGVRMDTVNALGKFGGEDMIPALRVVAEKDPAIRKWAAEAIVAIQQRTHPAPHPTVSGVMQGMKSPKWGQRLEAFGEAAELLASSDTSPKDADLLRLGIIRLLSHENKGGLKEPDDVKAENYGEGYGEDKSEYYAGIIEFVASFNDERAIPALLGAAGSGGMATRAVARFGKKALDPTLAQVQGKDPRLADDALFVIRDMLEFGLVTDPQCLLRIRNAVRSALDAEDSGLRDTAVYLVEYLDNREEFAPKLKNIADHDPAKLPNQPKADGSVGDFYFVRASARRSLQQIENHERPPIDRGLPPSEYEPVK